MNQHSSISPRVSVIIPNYNHSKYLHQRIDSVLSQTFQDIEVILMDDFSPDSSREIIADYAKKDSRVITIFNEKNSGSTFHQWNKGIAKAQGEFVWIAESDDYAEATFLERTISVLDSNPDVGIVNTASWVPNSEGKVIGSTDEYFGELDPTFWQNDFIIEGLPLVRKYMSYRNIIPNASAVVTRLAVLKQAGPANEKLRIYGDLFFWSKIFSFTNVAFIAEKLNYFRMHSNNVRSKTLANGIALKEHVTMLKYIKQFQPIDDFFYQKSINYFIMTWFQAIIYYRLPVAIQKEIFQGMSQIEPNFGTRLSKEFIRILFKNRLSGIRMAIGDGLIYQRKNSNNYSGLIKGVNDDRNG